MNEDFEKAVGQFLDDAINQPRYKTALESFQGRLDIQIPESLERTFRYFWGMGYLAGADAVFSKSDI